MRIRDRRGCIPALEPPPRHRGRGYGKTPSLKGRDAVLVSPYTDEGAAWEPHINQTKPSLAQNVDRFRNGRPPLPLGSRIDNANSLPLQGFRRPPQHLGFAALSLDLENIDLLKIQIEQRVIQGRRPYTEGPPWGCSIAAGTSRRCPSQAIALAHRSRPRPQRGRTCDPLRFFQRPESNRIRFEGYVS